MKLGEYFMLMCSEGENPVLIVCSKDGILEREFTLKDIEKNGCDRYPLCKGDFIEVGSVSGSYMEVRTSTNHEEFWKEADKK